MSSQQQSTASGAVTTGLKGNMGTASVMFTVLAYNGPAVVFFGFIPVVILYGNGAGTPALILAAGLLILLVASAILRVTKNLKRPGGYYSIISASLGKAAGLAGGAVAFLTYFPALLSVYALGGISLNGVITMFGGTPIPWWLGGLIQLVAVTILGYYNINLSAKTLFVLLGLELLLIGMYIVAVLFQGGESGLSFDGFQPEIVFSGAVAVGLLYAIGIFGGFEATVIFSEEVKSPERTIPRATYGTIALLGGMYALLAFSLINAFGIDNVMQAFTDDLTGASAASLSTFVGPWAVTFGNILLFTSSFALSLACHNILSRYLYNFGVDGILPKSLGQTHAKQNSPVRASMIVSILSVIFIVVLIVAQIPEGLLYAYTAGLYSYGMLILMTAVSFALGTYLVRKVPGASVHGIATMVGGVAFGAVLWYATSNFVLLSGIDGTAALLVISAFWLLILVSFVYGLSLKKSKPEVFARIGRE
jgi:amino acid transporter